MPAKSSAIVLALALSFAAPVFVSGADGVRKIRVGFPSLAFSYLPFYVAREKGILRKHGLEAEYIQMRTGIQPQALINGNINFFPSVSTGISAAVSGLPVVVVLNFCNGAPWVLVTSKEINKPQDLIGKNIAISGIRTSPHYFLQAALKKWEIPEKDVGIITTGGTADSFTALVSRRVAGTVVTPPFDDKAVSLGFKKFMFLGDLVDIPYVGVVTSQAEIKNNRETVRAALAALMESVSWIRANRVESTRMVAEKFKVTTAEAEQTYATLLKLLNKDGRLDPKVARGYVDLLRRERPIPADVDPQKFLDFSLLPAGG
ncbi:MAG TPA: ABC transporter substrate-binding protein [candidate division Zixibacteria bacterium]|nr:ABC transporter substrate-binding protein [candidate division Zixibacteria bacterium]